jgi:hypothetical protein
LFTRFSFSLIIPVPKGEAKNEVLPSRPLRAVLLVNDVAPSFVRSRRESVPEDKLEAIREKARQAALLEREAADLEERIKRAKENLRKIVEDDLQTMMGVAGIDRLGVEKKGNLPAFDLKVGPFYAANIAAAWDEDRRRKGFLALEEVDAGDLIKTEVTIRLPREAREDAKDLIATLENLYPEYAPEVRESVHHGTLGAWLKAQAENNRPLPPLEAIGARIGRVAKIEPREG